MISPGIDRDRITPEWLTKLTEPIEALYTALQRDLIVNIARQFNVFGRKANIPTSYAWRGYMLGQLGGLAKENYDTIARYSGDISEATRLAIQTSVEASVGVVDRAFMDEILDAEYAPEITETTERVTGYYVNQALEKQNLVNTVMLNSTRRYYEQTVGATSDALDQSLDAAQQALNAAAGGVIHGTTDFYSALRDCVRDMADHGLTGFYDKAGREWSAQAYVTMDMRTTAANAAREAAMERNREYGNELIAVSSHPGARPLCEPYQGGVYSTDGSTGETTDVHGASISYYPLELTSYGEAAGLFGINCGHYPSPFIPGLSVVRKLDISHEENERLYKESQRQRYMERRVRAAKIEADALKAAGDAEGAKAARAKARERNAELKAWCKERERAYYPEKVRVVRPEKTSEPNGSVPNLSPGVSNTVVSSGILTDSASTSRINTKDPIERALGVIKGEPYPIEEALVLANINHHERNCQRCVQAYEALRRGYPVSALPKPPANNTIGWGVECFVPSGTKTDARTAFSLGVSSDRIRSELSNAPDGARYVIYVDWGENQSHVFIGEKLGNAVYYIDPQTQRADARYNLTKGVQNRFGFCRIDNLPFTNNLDTIRATMGGIAHDSRQST